MKPTRDIVFEEPEKPKQKQAEEVVISSKITTSQVPLSSNTKNNVFISSGGMIAVIGPNALRFIKEELNFMIDYPQFWGYFKHESGYKVMDEFKNIFLENMTGKESSYISYKFHRDRYTRVFRVFYDEVMNSVRYIEKRRNSMATDEFYRHVSYILLEYWSLLYKINDECNKKYPGFFTILEIKPEDFKLQTIKQLKEIFNNENNYWTLIVVCNQSFEDNSSKIKRFRDKNYNSPDIFYKTFFDGRVYYTPEALK